MKISGENPTRVAIVTDSTADLPAELTQRLQISVVPNIIVLEGRSLQDGIDLRREDFYQALPNMKSLPVTGTASPGAYETLYDHLLSSGFSQILSIHASSLLSGIYNAAVAAAASFREQVQVLDSQNISLGLGFQVLAAAEAAVRGYAVRQLAEVISQLRPRIRLIAMLNTLEYVRRSGRVSWSRAMVGDLLRIKPFIEVRDGRVLSLGETRTFHKGVERLKSFLVALGDLERLAILHTNAEEQARSFLSSLGNQAPPDSLIVNVTTVIGAHVGPQCLGFAAVVR